jgi:hypothetical protein
MKLDEWKFKKYTSKRSTGSPHKDPRKPSTGYAVEHQLKPSSPEHSPLHQAEGSDTMIRSPPSESTQLSVNSQLTTSLQGTTKTIGRTKDKIPSLNENEVKILEREFRKDADLTFQKMFQFSPAVGADLGRVSVSILWLSVKKMRALTVHTEYFSMHACTIHEREMGNFCVSF